ncbi:hypothetical protein EV702DRAFT_1049603 [Suillus placidus]|uniref:Uncharacterized protein n=1 Tax=Suillus placidus TaxID=48579 RepID=A0A9P6ZM35_9AGAM|nr:hypothetical protein EV702DRAFT_1049603 [Suillus placidus]
MWSMSRGPGCLPLSPTLLATISEDRVQLGGGREGAGGNGCPICGATQSREVIQKLQVPSVPPNPPSTQPPPPPPPPQPQPTGQALAAQRTTQLIAQGRFSPIESEKQYPAQQSQPHFSPPPTQSQSKIQQPQFPPTPQFSQGQTSQARPQSQFTHGQTQTYHPHVPPQSHPHVLSQSHSHVPTQSHPHVPAPTHVQPQVHAPPNPPQQSQHYSTGPPDPYYLQAVYGGYAYIWRALKGFELAEKYKPEPKHLSVAHVSTAPEICNELGDWIMHDNSVYVDHEGILHAKLKIKLSLFATPR